MPEMRVEIDVSELERIGRAAVDALDHDLQQAGIKAARDGVALARASHPYEDRTGDLTGEAHVEEDHVLGGGLMTWPVDYASYVDRGTSRARAYPFTPKAKKLAAVMLNEGVQNAIARFRAILER